jgi:hypothetical protein
MKKNLTYIIFVVDRSGSMSSICKDMIGGFNSFIKKQKKINGDCKVFFYQFDTDYDTVYENLDLQLVADLTDKTYVPRGGTALYPSLGKTIEDIGKRLSAMSENERPERVLFVTITDGEHNSSLENVNGKRIDRKTFHQFTADQVKSMVEHQTQVYKWDFAYIGANQDAWAVGSSMGVSNNLNYVASAAGTKNMFDNLSDSTATYRSSEKKRNFTFNKEN